MLHFNYVRFTHFLMRVTFIIALFLSTIFADGIVLRNGMQMVVTIRDTSGDSISVLEGMWQAEIAKSQVESFWYNGKQYSYMKKSDTVSGPESIHEITFNQTPPVAKIPENDVNSTIGIATESTSAKALEEDLLPLPDKALLEDLDLNDNDNAPDKSAEMVSLFDPEYTNEELVRKKNVYRILLIAGCALGATSTSVFFVNGNWDAKILSVPFMSASIPLITVGTKKSIEYSKRYKAAEYKKHRAQMSLSLHIQSAELLMTF